MIAKSSIEGQRYDINNARLCIRNEDNTTLATYEFTSSAGCKRASDVGAQSSQT